MMSKQDEQIEQLHAELEKGIGRRKVLVREILESMKSEDDPLTGAQAQPAIAAVWD